MSFFNILWQKLRNFTQLFFTFFFSFFLLFFKIEMFPSSLRLGWCFVVRLLISFDEISFFFCICTCTIWKINWIFLIFHVNFSGKIFLAFSLHWCVLLGNLSYLKCLFFRGIRFWVVSGILSDMFTFWVDFFAYSCSNLLCSLLAYSFLSIDNPV